MKHTHTTNQRQLAPLIWKREGWAPFWADIEWGILRATVRTTFDIWSAAARWAS